MSKHHMSKYRMGTTGLKSKESRIFPISAMVCLIVKEITFPNVKKECEEKKRKESESEDT